VTVKESDLLQSELDALDELIRQLPESSIINRMSLEARKKEVMKELSLQTAYYEPARVQLTFRGKPTIKSWGIYADFAGYALDKYANMVALLGADQSYELGSRGVIPGKDDYQLIVTGTAVGSFGFEIEEAPKDTRLLAEFSPVKIAMEKTNLIMELSARSSDEEIAKAIEGISQRAIEGIRSFLEVMENYEADFAIKLDDSILRFDDLEQIKNTRERLSTDNIIEGERELLGTFQGVLPFGRKFEFRIKEPEEIIEGKINPDIDDANKIIQLVGIPTKIQVHTKQVGTSRPRYTLNSYEVLEE